MKHLHSKISVLLIGLISSGPSLALDLPKVEYPLEKNRLFPFVEVLSNGNNQICVYSTEVPEKDLKAYIAENSNNSAGLLEHVKKRWDLFESKGVNKSYFGPIDANKFIEGLYNQEDPQSDIRWKSIGYTTFGLGLSAIDSWGNQFESKTVEKILRGIKGVNDGQDVTEKVIFEGKNIISNADEIARGEVAKSVAQFGADLSAKKEQFTWGNILRRGRDDITKIVKGTYNLGKKARKFVDDPSNGIDRIGQDIVEKGKDISPNIEVDELGKFKRTPLAGGRLTDTYPKIKKLSTEAWKQIGGKLIDPASIALIIGEEAKYRRIELKAGALFFLAMGWYFSQKKYFTFETDEIEQFLSTYDILLAEHAKIKTAINIARV